MTDLGRTVWGPGLWRTLHTSAAMVGNQPLDTHAFCELLHNLEKTIPCPECRTHFSAYLKSYPPVTYIRSAVSASRYMWHCHNQVNVMLNKPEFPASAIFRCYNVDINRDEPRPVNTLRFNRGQGPRMPATPQRMPATPLTSRFNRGPRMPPTPQ